MFEFLKRCDDIRIMDYHTLSELDDNHMISFYSNCGCERVDTPIEFSPEIQKIIDDNKTYDDQRIVNGKIYANHIEYQSYIQSIVSGSQPDEILDANKTVLKLSKIKLLFDYPFNNPVMFTIRADDELVGFTLSELVDKIIKHYDLLIKINYNYNFNTLKFDDTIHNNFHSPDTNDIRIGITGIQYNKKNDVWVVQYDNYV